MTDQLFAQSSVPCIRPASRRDVLRFGAAATAAAFLPDIAQAQTPTVSGRVTISDDGRAPAPGRQRGLPGVLVSNGVDVVATDADGHYRMSPGDSGHIFVIKPAGYALKSDIGTMLPRHYIDIEEGRSFDFFLTKDADPKSFDAILMADPQPENHRHLDFIRDGALPQLARTGAAFGLALGDLVGDELGLLRRYNAIVGQTGIPWWNAGGNHDLELSAANHRDARAPFRAAYGPATYAFEQGEALFIVLDNVCYGGARHHGGDGRYRGRIGARQLSFIRNLLAHVPREKLIVLCMHIPLRTEWNPQSVSDNTDDADALLRLLAGRRAISFAGHMHAAEHVYLPAAMNGDRAEHHHQILAALSGSWWSGPYDHRGRPVAMGVDGAPPGFHVLQVDGAEYATHFVPLAQPQQRMRVVLSRCAPCATSGAYVIDGPAGKADLPCELVVNVFDGGARTKVRYRLPGGEWQAMARSRRADPFVVDLFADSKVFRHAWVKPEPCEHLWCAPLNLRSPGLHRMDIEVFDEFGHTIRETQALELA